jgi:dihydrofolate reductase/thymidylate synthase
MKLNLIYCKNNQNIIGCNNDLLFRIPNDMKYFKEITSQEFIKGHKNIVIMGYNTWKSIPDKYKPLEDRINIIITKNHFNEMNYEDENIKTFNDFDFCYKYLKQQENDGNLLGDKFIIGGAQLYNHVHSNYLHMINKVYETVVNYNVVKSEHTHYTNIMENDSLYPELDFRIDIYNDFKLINKKYMDGDEVTVIHNNSTLHGVTYNIYQNIRYLNNQEKQYLDLMKSILYRNNIKDSRNSKVISQFGEKMVFDLTKGFPLLTTKRTPFKTILRELLWFIRGSTSNKELNDKNVHIWDGNSSKEFLESRGLNYEEGELGPVYGFQWRRFGAEYTDKKQKDYIQGEGVDQLQNVIDLIKNDPTSRRIILSAWNPVDLDKMALPPCHVMIQFSVDKGFLDAQLYQRSGDMFLGVPFNIASYSILMHIIGSITGYTPRYFHHVLGDAHIYMNHIDAISEQVHRIPNKFPELKLAKKITDINNISEEDFILENYNHYPTIKADMIA